MATITGPLAEKPDPAAAPVEELVVAVSVVVPAVPVLGAEVMVPALPEEAVTLAEFQVAVAVQSVYASLYWLAMLAAISDTTESMLDMASWYAEPVAVTAACMDEMALCMDA